MDKSNGPSPAFVFDTINAYQRTAALKAATELDIFTHIAAGAVTPPEIASRAGAAVRGVRILCDTLTAFGFLTKENGRYALTVDSAAFLDRKSPAYIGGALEFLLSPELTAGFENLTAAVKKGGTATSELGTLAPEHPVWLQFARAMAPMMAPPAQALASLVPLETSRPCKILDISASHGMWGIAFARQNPKAHIVALDWAPVLKVATANANTAGISDRFSTIAGSAFEAELGVDYDVVLIPNFLHHFNVAQCVAFLRKVCSALRPDGQVAIVEFVPNSDRVSPPEVARFSLVMLASTPEGDAYTFSELEEMLAQAGFKSPQAHPLPPSFATAVIAAKN
jgi:ubiquinone/menaquinone biosynthesis C-methylase UbiE